MSVLKNMRELSNMEFYKNAVDLRNDLMTWVLKDFDTKRHPKNIQQYIKGLPQSDIDAITAIYMKNNINPNKAFESVYPEWFMNIERNSIDKYTRELMNSIIAANSIYPSKDKPYELEQRRKYQNIAIGICYKLYQELQYLEKLFSYDLNKLQSIFNKIDKESELLKGWRQSDNKRFNK